MGSESLVTVAERMPWLVAGIFALLALFLVLALAANLTADRKKATVVIVDDDDDVRRGLRHLIEYSSPLRVIGEAADGAAGFAAVESLRPDIVVADVRMPELDGYQLARRIKEASPQTSVVGYSSTDDDPTGAIMRRAGASAHLVKGDSPETILRTLLDLA